MDHVATRPEALAEWRLKEIRMLVRPAEDMEANLSWHEPEEGRSPRRLHH